MQASVNGSLTITVLIDMILLIAQSDALPVPA